MTAFPRVPIEGFFPTAEGASLFYRHWPALSEGGGSAVVILHRGHEHSGRVQHIADGLGMPEADIFAWDARGHGKSPGERGDSPDIGVSVKDVDDFMRHVRSVTGLPNERIVLVGQSVGAVLAAAWVHDYAPKLRALILASPAFDVKLYVPFARPLLAAGLALRGNFFVNSYVKAHYLTHDEERVRSYDRDPLITRAISTRVLLGLYSLGARLQKESSAISVPVQIFLSGSDFVVHEGPQRRFYEKLGSRIKELHTLPGFFHDTFGEKGREAVFEKIRGFLDQVDAEGESSRPKPDLATIDRWSLSADRYRELATPLSRCNPKGVFYGLYRRALSFMGNFSDGIALGLKSGFDSGSTLDYVYRNEPSGRGVFGRFLDKVYLESIGWRGIRIRRRHAEALLRKAAGMLAEQGETVRLMDIAAGHGRYVLDGIGRDERVASMLLRDFSDDNVQAGNKAVQERGLSEKARFVQGDAFDRASLAAVSPKPNLAVVSGLYELFPENAPLKESLAGLADAVEPGGFLVYTNQPRHPQQEMIARALTSHRGGQAWVMRCRTQAEMDALVEDAGFEKLEQFADEWGIFTVSLAVKR